MNTQHRLAVALGAAALAAGGLASAATAAPVLYGATGADSTDTSPPPVSKLYSIDPANGAATAIGSIGSAVTGLAVDPTSGTLYGVTADVERAGTPRQLLSINPATGAGTVVGSIGANEIEDIAFNSAGQLYGWNTVGDSLARISKTAPVSVTSVGPSGAGVTFGGALAFGVSGALYGLLNGDDGNLWTVDPASGVATKSRALNGTPNASGALMAAAAFGCDGKTLYSALNDYGAAANLVTVNTENGDVKNVGASVPALDALAIAGCPTTVSGAAPAAPSAVKDVTAPRLGLISKARQSLKALRAGGLKFTLKVNEPAKLRVTLNARPSKNGARGRSIRLARVTVNSASAGQLTVTLRPSSTLRARLGKEKRLPGLLMIEATDAAGNKSTRTKTLSFR